METVHPLHRANSTSWKTNVALLSPTYLASCFPVSFTAESELNEGRSRHAGALWSVPGVSPSAPYPTTHPICPVRNPFCSLVLGPQTIYLESEVMEA